MFAEHIVKARAELEAEARRVLAGFVDLEAFGRMEIWENEFRRTVLVAAAVIVGRPVRPTRVQGLESRMNAVSSTWCLTRLTGEQ
jgi:hypothetical protein